MVIDIDLRAEEKAEEGKTGRELRSALDSSEVPDISSAKAFGSRGGRYNAGQSRRLPS